MQEHGLEIAWEAAHRIIEGLKMVEPTPFDASDFQVDMALDIFETTHGRELTNEERDWLNKRSGRHHEA